MFSTHLDNFLPFPSNLKLLSANSFSLEESKICRLVMDIKDPELDSGLLGVMYQGDALTLSLLMTTYQAFVDSVDQDPIAQSMQSDF